MFCKQSSFRITEREVAKLCMLYVHRIFVYVRVFQLLIQIISVSFIFLIFFCKKRTQRAKSKLELNAVRVLALGIVVKNRAEMQGGDQTQL